MAALSLLTACGGTGASPSSSAKPDEPVTVNVGQSILTLSNAGMYVAIEKGFYKERNVTFTLTTLQSGSTATQAIASGSVDFVSAGSFDVATAVSKGVPLQAFVANSGITLEICASKKLAQSKNLSTSSQLSDIMAALKGGTVGITGPNSAPDLVLRYMLQKHGKLKPDTDVKIVSLGSVPAELTAIQRGQIDAFIQSPPGCEQAQAAGTGLAVMRPSQLPSDLTGMPLGVLYTRKDYVQKNRSVVERVVQSTAKGVNFARNNTEETLAILKKYFPTLDDTVLRDAYTNVVQGTLSKDGKMSQAAWDKVSDLLLSSGAIDKKLNTKEGDLWTNSFNNK
jgi:NitT/TauT family transport system substrate-binding protein